MFRKAEQQKSEIVNGIRGGRGDVGISYLLNTEESFGKLKGAVRCVIPDGSEIGVHAHGPDAEIYYLISGELQGNDNGNIVTMSPGDIMYTGNGENHGWKNISGQDAVLLGIVIN